MFYRLLMMIFALGISAAAYARDVSVGSARLKLGTASGFCELDESQSADKRMLTAVRGMVGTNTLLAMMADCKQLKAWRAHKLPLLQNIIQYQTVTSLMDESMSSDSLKTACAEMRASGEKMATDQLPDVRSRAETFMKKVDITGNQFLGVLDETPGEVCYSALLQRFKAETGANIVQVNIWATTAVHDKLVYLYYMSPYTDSGSMAATLANLKIYYADFVAANK